MNRRKQLFKPLTFTILSNDAGKVVMRFRIPKAVVYTVLTFVCVIFMLLSYLIYVNYHQKQEAANLAADLSDQTKRANELQRKIDDLAEKETTLKAQMDQLSA